MPTPPSPYVYPPNTQTLAVQCGFDSGRWSFTSNGQDATWVAIPAGGTPQEYRLRYQASAGLTLLAASLRRKQPGEDDRGLLTLTRTLTTPLGLPDHDGWTVTVVPRWEDNAVEFSLTHVAPSAQPHFIGLSLTVELNGRGILASSPDPQMEVGSQPT